MTRPAFSWLFFPFAIFVGACGGSSSETPWPAEPENNSTLGPAGEAASGVSDERDDAGPAEPPPKPTKRKR
jgi:hypothetical protein